MTFGWSLYRDNLTFSQMSRGVVGENPPSPPKPFHRISTEPSGR